EICTPVSTKQDNKHISQVMANLDAKITKNDGFHIHMSSSNIPREQIVVAWLMIEPIISKCFPRSRQNNIFCRAIWKAFQNKTHPIYTYIDRALTRMNNHYVAFSLEDMNRVRNTVEFRLPESTTDPVMIQNCIKFVYAFMKYAKIVKPTTHGHKKITSIRGVGSMVKVMDIKDQDLVKWLVQRHKQHKDATLTKAEQKTRKKNRKS
ncbi:MAG: amidoligase family protein, partial [Nitrosopumilus sp.]